MRLSNAQIGCLLAGVAGVTVLVYFAHLGVDDSGKSQPRYEGQLATAGLFNAVIDSLDTGDHYFHPNMCVPGQTQIFTPHRYPSVSGGNITALIHHGLTPLNRQAPQDSDWINRPPADVMW